MASKKLFLGNLSYKVDESKLDELFSEFNDVVDIRVIREHQTKRSKGFGFIEFESEESAKRAKESFDGNEFEGRALKIDWAHDKERA